MSDKFNVLPLHQHLHLLDDCSEVLNQQWTRSKAARDHSITKSTDHLPVSLAFVKPQQDEKNKVLGFSKISDVQGIDKAGLIESVVVRKEDRGKGLGRILMTLTEQYGKMLGLKTMYLSTHDKEGFYAHLGYERCQPVICLGANAHRVPQAMLQHFMMSSSTPPPKLPDLNAKTETETKESVKQTSSKQESEHSSQSSPVVPPPPAPVVPPPPPPPPPAPVVPPPPPPPPAPSLPHTPPPPLPAKSKPSGLELVTCMDMNSVVWMKKDLS